MSHIPSGQDSMRQRLDDAIEILTTSRLQTVLREICNESPEAFKLVCDKLLVMEHQLDRPIVSLLDGPLAETPAFKIPRAGKRGREIPGRRYEICEQCEKEYDTLEEKLCVWHLGDLEMDDDDVNNFWADWDENVFGDPDTDENRKEYPEGFVWTCCKGKGDAKGCKETAHKPRDVKRQRTETSDDDSSSHYSDSDEE
ncbi:hypothetical protein G6011_09194 [Alternaria panax]|uniref:Uncharacterized protein n=1 Tax=Alternaria panax TaxID=48097 RepID=A0AAD4NM81_9PLEO|nr:hypothetical protein G6011_09194 [Alternaria panax]